MGMPAAITIVDSHATEKDITNIFSYFNTLDNTFSTYKKTSEIAKINAGTLLPKQASHIVREIFTLCEQTKKETHGYFDMHRNEHTDPSGIVKGYAIYQGARMLKKKGFNNFYIEIAGDIEVSGKNDEGKPWKVGIENPFNRKELIKIITLENKGIATSGNYIRGNHIYNPIHKNWADDIISISVIGPNVFDADRFATAAFAMGVKGLSFIENLQEFEGYMITKDKKAYMTNGFQKYVV